MAMLMVKAWLAAMVSPFLGFVNFDEVLELLNQANY